MGGTTGNRRRKRTVKQISGVLAVIAGIITATAVTAICMLWWTTSDVIRELRQR
jgi:hypothetical protein